MNIKILVVLNVYLKKTIFSIHFNILIKKKKKYDEVLIKFFFAILNMCRFLS
jgi:hypothetical protein